jgi:hypothetical protein
MVTWAVAAEVFELLNVRDQFHFVVRGRSAIVDAVREDGRPPQIGDIGYERERSQVLPE